MSDRDERSRSRDRSKRDRPSRFSETSRDRSSDRGRDRGGKSGSQCRVYVSNIPYEYRWQDLKDLFRNQVGDVAFVELFVDENDKPRGCGIVEFSDPNSVKKCLEVMHRFELKNRKLVIKEDFGNQRDKYGNLIGSAASKRAREREDRDRYRDDRRGGGNFDLPSSQSSRGLSDGDNKWGNTFGLSPQFLDSLGINCPIINRVFVANLDYKVDKKKLKEVFRLAGKVQKVDLSTDRDGNSRGFAVIEFDHPVEAVQAISMFHNQQLYDRTMTVRMDREGDRQSIKLPEGLKGMGMGLGQNGEPLRDVARNLPNANPNPQVAAAAAVANSGAGLLGAVPNTTLPLGISSALSSLNPGAALSSLGSNTSVFQAANLANLSSNLLGGGVGAGDLSLAASLVNNPIVQNSSLAALAANTGSGSFERGNSSGPSNQSGPTYQSASSLSQGFLSAAGNRGGSSGFNEKTSAGFGFGSTDRDTRLSAGSLFNGNQAVRNSSNSITIKRETSGYSNKILISNLPPTAGLRMLSEKCSEFGEVQRIDDKGSGSVLVIYGNEWEAERAIKNMDRARIDGRTIDVRFYY